MGIFDFLGDLSSKRGKELGLGGFKSLLGTRKAAEAGARGDEMMKITGNDSLPGYFNEQTREYVPWYVDLFDGGGLNSAGGEAAKMPAAETGLLGGGPSPRGAGVRSQVRPSSLDQLDPFGGAGPNIPENPLGPFGGAGPRISGGDPRNLGGAEGYGQTGVAPGGTIVPLDEILTPEEIARRDAEAKMAQIKSGNFTFADLVRMDNSGQPAGFQPSPEPSSMQSLDQPFGSRIVPVSTAGPSSQPDSNIMLSDLYKGTGRDMPKMPGMDAPLAPQSFLGGAIDAPFAGFPTADENSLWDRALSGELAESNRAALNKNASTSNPSLPQSQSVDAAEFQRFRSKFEDNFKRNGIWGNTEREQAAFDYQKSRGANY